MAHVMVVGDTPVLKKVSLFLAGHDNVVTLIGESESRLLQVKADAGVLKDKIQTLQLNSQDTASSIKKLADAVKKFGPVTLTVNWTRQLTSNVHRYFAEFLNRTSPVCRYFQIVASESGQINPIPVLKESFRDLDKVLYRRVVVGYPSGNLFCDLLEYEEIADGIITAIRSDSRDYLIGSEEWDERQQIA